MSFISLDFGTRVLLVVRVRGNAQPTICRDRTRHITVDLYEAMVQMIRRTAALFAPGEPFLDLKP
jgi:hypothetical protein